MKKSSRILSCLMALLLMLPCFTVFASASDSGGNDGTDKTKRIVSVLYDNSASMKDPVDKKSGDDTSRSAYAKYSLRMLMSLLGENDELIITPLNSAESGWDGVSDDKYSVAVDLSAKNREKVINDIFDKSKKNFLVEAPRSLTPGGPPLSVALNILENGMDKDGKHYGGGLKKSDKLTNEKSDTEHWLVIISDGAFSDTRSVIITKSDGTTDETNEVIPTDELIEEKIKDYTTLKTIFIGISSDAPDLSGSERLAGTTTYVAKSATEIVEVMQDVANQLTGRCPAGEDYYSVSGNKVTLDLDKCQYAVKSVSVIVQNSGVTATSAKYKGSKVDLLQPCVISTGENNFTEFKDYIDMAAGYTAVVESDTYMYGGKMEFEFSGSVNTIAVMLEPALRVETYLEYNDGGTWKRTDMQHINSTMSGGDQIRAGFEVFEQATGNKIDLENIFGKVESQVTYARKEYAVGEPFALKVGNNEIVVSVSVLDGAYKISSSTICIIEANPSDYRVECTKTDRSEPGKLDVDMEYTVYVNNRPITKDELDRYTAEAVLISPSGEEKQLKTSADGNGKIKTNATLTSGEFGDYEVKFTITSEYWLSRSNSMRTGFYPKALGLAVKGADTISVSQHGIKKNTKSFTFALSSMDFDSSIIKYRLEVDGKDLTEYAVVDGKTITYVPAADHFGGSVSIGAKSVDLIVECPSFPTVNEKATVTLDITDIAYELNPLDRGNKKLDRFDVKGSDAALYFEVTRDGERLPLAELEASVKAGEFKVKDPSGVFSWCFWLPTGIEVNAVEDGVVEYKVVRDRISILGVNFMSMFMSGGDKNITAEYRKADATATLTVGDSPAFAYIWRILFFILLVYLLLWAAGFFFGLSKSFGRGVFISISPTLSGRADIRIIKRINLRFRDKWLWHFGRLVPWKLWSHQPEVKMPGVTLTFKVPKRLERKMQKGALMFNKSETYAMMDNFTDASIKFSEYTQSCYRSYRKTKSIKATVPKLSADDVVSMFSRDELVYDGSPTYKKLATGMPYGFYYKDKLDKIIIFVSM